MWSFLQKSTSTEPSDDGSLDADAVVRLLQATTDVYRRHQFFRWIQTHLAAFVPHDVLSCGTFEHARRALEFDLFDTVVLGTEVRVEFCDAQSQLIRLVLPAWLGSGQQAVVVRLPNADHALTPLVGPWRALASKGITELLVHGVMRSDQPREIDSFFVFAVIGREQALQTTRSLNLLMPYLHSTYARVRATERESSPFPTAMPRAQTQAHAVPMSARNTPLTQRERQILAWVREGKSNLEIGNGLSISALTVKNHVQNILRKLDASNRTQAVAKATSLGLLGLTGSDSGFADLSGALQGFGPARAADEPKAVR